MRRMRMGALLVVSSGLAVGVPFAKDAEACGGCFVQQSESTQVSGHRMVLSVSATKTTLWDQITYSGAPESFAWVLPTKGIVEVGISSDALFQNLEARTTVDVLSPFLNCASANADSSLLQPTSVQEAGEGKVTVLAQEVVGPYETVQLSAEDPEALSAWLTSHGYAVPLDIAPVIAAYVAEGSDFLALKLVPGQGIQSMRPVRISTPGASPLLPLRMVAAGTGAVTPITLWVLGGGRYEPANFPWFTIPASEIVWDWDTSSSNYSVLLDATFDGTKGRGWQVEAAEPLAKFDLEQTIMFLAESQPVESGYGDDQGAGAMEAAKEDLDDLLGALDPGSLWVTRLHARLPREALGTDLAVWAAADQVVVPRTLVAEKTIGTPPCGGGATNGGTDPWRKPGRLEGRACAVPEGGPGATPDEEEGAPRDTGAEDDEDQEKVHASGGGACAVAGVDRGAAAFATALLAAALGLMGRRRARAR